MSPISDAIMNEQVLTTRGYLKPALEKAYLFSIVMPILLTNHASNQRACVSTDTTGLVLWIVWTTVDILPTGDGLDRWTR